MQSRKLLESKITEVLENLTGSGEYVLAVNYCQEFEYYDDEPIENEASIINEFCSGMTPYDIIEKYGELGSKSWDYFKFDGYGNVVEWEGLEDTASISEIVDYIIDNENALDNEEIQYILDEYADLDDKITDIIYELEEEKQEEDENYQTVFTSELLEEIVKKLEEETETIDEQMFDDCMEELDEFVKDYLDE